MERSGEEASSSDKGSGRIIKGGESFMETLLVSPIQKLSRSGESLMEEILMIMLGDDDIKIKERLMSVSDSEVLGWFFFESVIENQKFSDVRLSSDFDIEGQIRSSLANKPFSLKEFGNFGLAGIRWTSNLVLMHDLVGAVLDDVSFELSGEELPKVFQIENLISEARRNARKEAKFFKSTEGLNLCGLSGSDWSEVLASTFGENTFINDKLFAEMMADKVDKEGRMYDRDLTEEERLRYKEKLEANLITLGARPGQNYFVRMSLAEFITKTADTGAVAMKARLIDAMANGEMETFQRPLNSRLMCFNVKGTAYGEMVVGKKKIFRFATENENWQLRAEAALVCIGKKQRRSYLELRLRMEINLSLSNLLNAANLHRSSPGKLFATAEECMAIQDDTWMELMMHEDYFEMDERGEYIKANMATLAPFMALAGVKPRKEAETMMQQFWAASMVSIVNRINVTDMLFLEQKDRENFVECVKIWAMMENLCDSKRKSKCLLVSIMMWAKVRATERQQSISEFSSSVGQTRSVRKKMRQGWVSNEGSVGQALWMATKLLTKQDEFRLDYSMVPIIVFMNYLRFDFIGIRLPDMATWLASVLTSNLTAERMSELDREMLDNVSKLGIKIKNSNLNQIRLAEDVTIKVCLLARFMREEMAKRPAVFERNKEESMTTAGVMIRMIWSEGDNEAESEDYADNMIVEEIIDVVSERMTRAVSMGEFSENESKLLMSEIADATLAMEEMTKVDIDIENEFVKRTMDMLEEKTNNEGRNVSDEAVLTCEQVRKIRRANLDMLQSRVDLFSQSAVLRAKRMSEEVLGITVTAPETQRRLLKAVESVEDRFDSLEQQMVGDYDAVRSSIITPTTIAEDRSIRSRGREMIGISSSRTNLPSRDRNDVIKASFFEVRLAEGLRVKAAFSFDLNWRNFKEAIGRLTMSKDAFKELITQEKLELEEEEKKEKQRAVTIIEIDDDEQEIGQSGGETAGESDGKNEEVDRGDSVKVVYKRLEEMILDSYKMSDPQRPGKAENIRWWLKGPTWVLCIPSGTLMLIGAMVTCAADWIWTSVYEWSEATKKETIRLANEDAAEGRVPVRLLRVWLRSSIEIADSIIMTALSSGLMICTMSTRVSGRMSKRLILKFAVAMDDRLSKRSRIRRKREEIALLAMANDRDGTEMELKEYLTSSGVSSSYFLSPREIESLLEKTSLREILMEIRDIEADKKNEKKKTGLVRLAFKVEAKMTELAYNVRINITWVKTKFEKMRINLTDWLKEKKSSINEKLIKFTESTRKAIVSIKTRVARIRRTSLLKEKQRGELKDRLTNLVKNAIGGIRKTVKRLATRIKSLMTLRKENRDKGSGKDTDSTITGIEIGKTACSLASATLKMIIKPMALVLRVLFDITSVIIKGNLRFLAVVIRNVGKITFRPLLYSYNVVVIVTTSVKLCSETMKAMAKGVKMIVKEFAKLFRKPSEGKPEMGSRETGITEFAKHKINDVIRISSSMLKENLVANLTKRKDELVARELEVESALWEGARYADENGEELSAIDEVKLSEALRLNNLGSMRRKEEECNSSTVTKISLSNGNEVKVHDNFHSESSEETEIEDRLPGFFSREDCVFLLLSRRERVGTIIDSRKLIWKMELAKINKDWEEIGTFEVLTNQKDGKIMKGFGTVIRNKAREEEIAVTAKHLVCLGREELRGSGEDGIVVIATSGTDGRIAHEDKNIYKEMEEEIESRKKIKGIICMETRCNDHYIMITEARDWRGTSGLPCYLGDECFVGISFQQLVINGSIEVVEGLSMIIVSRDFDARSSFIKQSDWIEIEECKKCAARKNLRKNELRQRAGNEMETDEASKNKSVSLEWVSKKMTYYNQIIDGGSSMFVNGVEVSDASDYVAEEIRLELRRRKGKNKLEEFGEREVNERNETNWQGVETGVLEDVCRIATMEKNKRPVQMANRSSIVTSIETMIRIKERLSLNDLTSTVLKRIQTSLIRREKIIIIGANRTMYVAIDILLSMNLIEHRSLKDVNSVVSSIRRRITEPKPDIDIDLVDGTQLIWSLIDITSLGGGEVICDCKLVILASCDDEEKKICNLLSKIMGVLASKIEVVICKAIQPRPSDGISDKHDGMYIRTGRCPDLSFENADLEIIVENEITEAASENLALTKGMTRDNNNVAVLTSEVREGHLAKTRERVIKDFAMKSSAVSIISNRSFGSSISWEIMRGCKRIIVRADIPLFGGTRKAYQQIRSRMWCTAEIEVIMDSIRLAMLRQEGSQLAEETNIRFIRCHTEGRVVEPIAGIVIANTGRMSGKSKEYEFEDIKTKVDSCKCFGLSLGMNDERFANKLESLGKVTADDFAIQVKRSQVLPREVLESCDRKKTIINKMKDWFHEVAAKKKELTSSILAALRLERTKIKERLKEAFSALRIWKSAKNIKEKTKKIITEVVKRVGSAATDLLRKLAGGKKTRKSRKKTCETRDTFDRWDNRDESGENSIAEAAIAIVGAASLGLVGASTYSEKIKTGLMSRRESGRRGVVISVSWLAMRLAVGSISSTFTTVMKVIGNVAAYAVLASMVTMTFQEKVMKIKVNGVMMESNLVANRKNFNALMDLGKTWLRKRRDDWEVELIVSRETGAIISESGTKIGPTWLVQAANVVALGANLMQAIKKLWFKMKLQQVFSDIWKMMKARDDSRKGATGKLDSIPTMTSWEAGALAITLITTAVIAGKKAKTSAEAEAAVVGVISERKHTADVVNVYLTNRQDFVWIYRLANCMYGSAMLMSRYWAIRAVGACGLGLALVDVLTQKNTELGMSFTLSNSITRGLTAKTFSLGLSNSLAAWKNDNNFTSYALNSIVITGIERKREDKSESSEGRKKTKEETWFRKTKEEQNKERKTNEIMMNKQIEAATAVKRAFIEMGQAEKNLDFFEKDVWRVDDKEGEKEIEILGANNGSEGSNRMSEKRKLNELTINQCRYLGRSDKIRRRGQEKEIEDAGTRKESILAIDDRLWTGVVMDEYRQGWKAAGDSRSAVLFALAERNDMEVNFEISDNKLRESVKAAMKISSKIVKEAETIKFKFNPERTDLSNVLRSINEVSTSGIITRQTTGQLLTGAYIPKNIKRIEVCNEMIMDDKVPLSINLVNVFAKRRIEKERTSRLTGEVGVITRTIQASEVDMKTATMSPFAVLDKIIKLTRNANSISVGINFFIEYCKDDIITQMGVSEQDRGNIMRIALDHSSYDANQRNWAIGLCKLIRLELISASKEEEKEKKRMTKCIENHYRNLRIRVMMLTSGDCFAVTGQQMTGHATTSSDNSLRALIYARVCARELKKMKMNAPEEKIRVQGDDTKLEVINASKLSEKEVKKAISETMAKLGQIVKPEKMEVTTWAEGCNFLSHWRVEKLMVITDGKNEWEEIKSFPMRKRADVIGMLASVLKAADKKKNRRRKKDLELLAAKGMSFMIMFAGDVVICVVCLVIIWICFCVLTALKKASSKADITSDRLPWLVSQSGIEGIFEIDLERILMMHGCGSDVLGTKTTAWRLIPSDEEIELSKVPRKMVENATKLFRREIGITSKKMNRVLDEMRKIETAKTGEKIEIKISVMKELISEGDKNVKLEIISKEVKFKPLVDMKMEMRREEEKIGLEEAKVDTLIVVAKTEEATRRDDKNSEKESNEELMKLVTGLQRGERDAEKMKTKSMRRWLTKDGIVIESEEELTINEIEGKGKIGIIREGMAWRTIDCRIWRTFKVKRITREELEIVMNNCEEKKKKRLREKELMEIDELIVTEDEVKASKMKEMSKGKIIRLDMIAKVLGMTIDEKARDLILAKKMRKNRAK